MLKTSLLFLVLLSLALPTVVLAVPAADCIEYCDLLGTAEEKDPPKDPSDPSRARTCICNPLEADDFDVIVNNILNFLFRIAVVLVPLMAVVAGFMFVTAGGSPDQINKARNIIIWTAVGLGILLLSKGILAIINQLLGVKG